ncbi:MAG: hypothetical protein KF905_09685 [Flavobacteriales bacterium]|nr:hypothetical protein [Flavobacteriales bacterium]
MSLVPFSRRIKAICHTGGARWLIRSAGVWLLSVLLWAGNAHAQDPSNLRQRWLPVSGDSLVLDTLSLVPGSVHLFASGLPIGEGLYTVDPYDATLVWRSRPQVDSVYVRYRVLPLLMKGVRNHKDPARLYTPNADLTDPFRYVPPRQQGDLLGMQGLNRSGSISRGVLFGNNQDLAVNSTLNLELSGRVSDRISVLASITDNNIPIQAGGNTLELQDFDQVFIKLYEEDDRATGNKWELIAGDFVLQRPNSHFLTYLKKTKGLGFTARHGAPGGGSSTSGGSIAISKGQFARNVIQGVEGVQGPYRLRGSIGEQFIVVLSGTERVFIDGQPMLRGQENDYVIDYNTAEVTFTARRMITKDRRIVVEFQYSDKNYARSLVRVENTTDMGATQLRLNVYSEQDHRNQSLQQQLSDTEREVLALAGDDPLAAAVPGVDSTGFASDQVLYRRTDSLGYGPVYVFSTDPEQAVYRLIFSQVSAGNGDYVQQEFTPNGRVFRWVAPDTVNGGIVRRGDHAPVRVLIPPRSQQLLTLALDHKFSQRTEGTVELAFSNNDLNTFSSADDKDNGGLAIMTRLSHAIPISARDTTMRLVIGGDIESTSIDFKPLERYRAVEFERNWNVQGLALAGEQLLAEARVGIAGRSFGQFGLGSGTFMVGDLYRGYKQQVVSNVRLGRSELIGTGSWLTTELPDRSDFLRHKGQLKHRFKRFSLGYADEHERNLFRSVESDALRPGSYQFHDWEVFIQSPDTSVTKWRLAGGQRMEQAWRDSSLVRSTMATSYSALFALNRNPRNRLATSFTYRSLAIVDSTLSAQRPEDTYLARVDYNLTLWKGVAVLSSFYEFGSGLEQQREYIYIEVPAGQGLYVWIDYNGNGIRELNEFELANFGYEANFLRVFVPSNSYVRVFSNQFSSSLDVRPGVRWAEAKGMKGVIGKFSDAASLRSDRKTGGQDVAAALNPFLPVVNDTSLTSQILSARNTLYYDRTSRTWSVDHTWQNDQSRTLLLNGFESRSRSFNTVRVRWNTTRHWTLDIESEQGRISNASDLLVGRTYAIDQESLRPRVTWQPNTSFRAILFMKVTEKRNQAEFGGETTTLRDLGMELRYNTAGKGSLLANFNLVGIDHDGEVNSSLGNELLGGLKPGTNATWSVSLQRNLSGNMQVDLTYNGRRSEGVPVVHVGGAQVRAFF